MGSEVRRAAAALVASREERFATRRGRADASERVERALAPMSFPRTGIKRQWIESPNGLELVVSLSPMPGVQRSLRAASLLLVGLFAASAWAILSEEATRTVAFLVPMATGFVVLALPVAAAALGSQREAEEARLRKAIRAALADEAG
ncbi:MAG TPA: hypothetical protein VH040_00665 [Usitatibacter sp.]|jgi:hypothetical protein|nr:hypothetical protein [Usitatibacter sp.]